MITIKEVVDEYVEHGNIENSLKLMDYGARLNNTLVRHNCSLSEALASIRQAVMIQMQSFPLGDSNG